MAARERADRRDVEERRSPEALRQRARFPSTSRAEKADQPPARIQQEPADREGDGGKGKLQRQPEQQARLEEGVEREALCVQQPLDELLGAVGDQREQEEAAGADSAAVSRPRASDHGADPDDDQQRSRDPEPEDDVAGVAVAHPLVQGSWLSGFAVSSVSCRDDGRADRVRRERARRREGKSEQPGEAPPTHDEIVARLALSGTALAAAPGWETPRIRTGAAPAANH